MFFWTLCLFISSSFGATPVSLDHASVEGFARLDTIDEGLAQSIVALREGRGGHLTSVESLRVINGITESSLEVLRKNTQVSIEFPVQGRRFSSADEVLRQFDDEPSVKEVQMLAAEYAQVNRSTVSQWLRASRRFAALPRVQTKYRYQDKSGNNWNYTPAPTVGDQPVPELTGAKQDRDAYYEVRATWNLDKLVMSSERIRVINEAQDVVKLRDKVLSEVTRLYFERRRAQVDALLSPKSGLSAQVKEQLKLAELTANIDALTGGAFSARVSRKRTD